jgi:hypothetical protein
MTNRATEILLALLSGGGFWLIGFWGQRMYNEHNSDRKSIPASGFWAYLFGVHPKTERVYLRLAIVQIVSLVHLVLVMVTVWFLDPETVRDISSTYVLLWLFVGGLWGIVQDLINKRRQ